jgi:YidC/Oxa1 family membrane protein insertase
MRPAHQLAPLAEVASHPRFRFDIMERAGLSRFVLFAALAALLFFGLPKLFGGKTEFQPIQPAPVTTAPNLTEPPKVCDLWSPRYRATVSARGAALTRFELLEAKYTKEGQSSDMVTTPDHPELSPLFVGFRNPAVNASDWLVQYDVKDWSIVRSSATVCELTYQDAQVKLTKTISVGAGPYELRSVLGIENVGGAPGSYALLASTADFLPDHAVKSGMFTMNPKTMHVECVSPDATATRKRVDDFDASDFADAEHFPKTELNRGDWYQAPGNATTSAASNAYFTNALYSARAPVAPVCQLQIQELWHSGQYSSKSADPNAASLYKARLAFPKRTLAPGAKDEFEFVAYVGPKEREALSKAGPQFQELIDLGFFSAIAKILVSFLLKVHGVIPNWGIAIIVLTITARILLFPLTVPSIKNMIHMRELKPEIDALNEKYKDDPQAKGLAQMELWKKHGVNPMKGCLPQLASMPVWFALYTTLQTAVELYNIPFLWFPDLSMADPYYILPFIIGATYFVQQKLMPMQAGDPAQQKLMLYFMPGMFTVFMLFLPAGLGIYMFTNSLLGIGQQQIVERHVRHSLAARKAQASEPPAAAKARTGKKAK